jgi:phage host-nuclease inhibitor protein Gam
MNQLRAEKQAHVKNIEVLQEEVYRVATTMNTTRSMIKQAVDDSTEKLQI